MSELLLQYSLPVIQGQQRQAEKVPIERETSSHLSSTKTLPQADFSIRLQSVPEIQKKYLPDIGSPLRRRS